MGGRGAGYSLTGSGEESKGTKKSKAKLAVLQASLDSKFNDHVNNMRARQGQPWHIEKARGRAEKNRADKEMASINGLREKIERQKQVVERQIARDKARGSLFDYKGNLNITTRNIKQVKAYLKDLDSGKVPKTRTAATIRTWKKKVANLEASMKTASKTKVSASAKSLIDSGKVTQWAKRPNTYFIKGLKKTALELQPDGTFKHSPRYFGPATDEHRARVANFIKTGKL
jgi:hypothetical protein